MPRVEFLGSFPEAPPETGLPEVAFAGRSNVGKSSAINALLGTRAARTSRTPGRTRAFQLYRVADRLCLVDLPGYGYARVSRRERESWKERIEAYLGEREELRLVVVLVDARIPAQEPDRVLLRGLAEAGIPALPVATKVDALRPSRRAGALACLGRDLGIEEELLPFSARTRQGVDALWARLAEATGVPRRVLAGGARGC